MPTVMELVLPLPWPRCGYRTRDAKAASCPLDTTPEILYGFLLDLIWFIFYIKLYDPIFIILYFSHDYTRSRKVLVPTEEHHRSNSVGLSTEGGCARHGPYSEWLIG